MIATRHHAHRGSVLATGFVIDIAIVGIAEARRRVLALWMPGARVHQDGGALLVTGLPIMRVRAHLAPGAPVVAQHGVLATMPLDADEARALAAPDAVVVTRRGVADVVLLRSSPPIDIAAWIDLTDFEVAAVEALAAPPAVVAVPAAPPSDLRTLLGVAKDVEAEHRAAGRVRARSIGDLRPPRWLRWLSWLADRLAPRKLLDEPGGSVSGQPTPATRSAPASTGAASGPADARPSGSPTGASLLGRLRGWIATRLWTSRLGVALARHHAAYVRRVLELFDRGELDEALRRALPIGGGDEPASRLGLGLPRRRDDLRLSLEQRGSSAAIPFGDAALEMMRARYRAAAAKLERSGRIDDAAFVLAELLSDVDAAIALLERHRRFELAARLAAARGLPPGLVVRLWFLAGDLRRAILWAQRHRAWADAIARLERVGDAQAAALRSLWAEHLAATGDLLQAVDVLWPIEPARPLVGSWIDRGIAGGGAAAARLMIKKLVITPDSLPAIAPAMLAILADRDPDAARWRLALSEELVSAPPSPELRTIARHAYRALLRDCATGAVAADVLKRLVEISSDAALRADRPVVPTSPRPAAADAHSELALRWPQSDAGALPVYDAACLPGARFLVALGELGVRILGRDERTIAHIDQPATRLAVSDLGTRALAIAPRGQLRRLARLDLIERRGQHWCDVELDSFARSFDGDLWIASRGRSVVAVDTTDARWQATWGIEIDPPAAGCSVRRDGEWFAIEALARGGGELWYYEGFTLRRRRDEPAAESQLIAARPSGQDWIAAYPGLLRGPDWSIVLDDAPPIALEIAADIAVVGLRDIAGMIAIAVHLGKQRILARLYLDGATAISLRLAGWLLTVADDRGRLIVIDLEHGTLHRDLRVS